MITCEINPCGLEICPYVFMDINWADIPTCHKCEFFEKEKEGNNEQISDIQKRGTKI